jgi:hypothetical protein
LVDAYTDDALKEWFEDRDIATGLHRKSDDPAYLHTYVYLDMKREEEECGIRA